MSRRSDVCMLVASVVGLLIAVYATCPPPARADTQTLRIGEQCVDRPVEVPSLVVSATSAAMRLVDARAAMRCAGALSECTRRVIRATRPEPQWRVAVRWTLTGIAIGGAFALGVAL